MKKFCLLSMALFATASAWGQAVLGYDFAVTQGEFHSLVTEPQESTTYLDLSAVTDMTETAFTPDGIVTSEDIDVTGFDLGFTVNFNGTECDHFVIYGLGVVQLGGETISLLTTGDGWTITQGLVNGLMCYNNTCTALADETKIIYRISGEAPNRKLTVEYNQIGLKEAWWADEWAHLITYQISICEDGTISYCFEEFDAGEENYKFYVGLTGNMSEYITLSGNSLDEGVVSTNASTVSVNKIAAGKTVTLTPPSDCAAPAAQPTNLQLTSTSNKVNGMFDPSEDADHYLIVYTDGSEMTATPEDGMTYAQGDEIGNAKVWKYTTDTDFEVHNQPGGTAYKFYIFGANSYCSNGPVYLNAAPLTLDISTKPASPAALSATPSGLNSIKVNVTGNEAGDNILVVYNSELLRDMYGDHALIGTISGIYNTGDEIEGGGKVAYAGPATEEIVVEGLEPSTAYHFMAYCYNDQAEYSTDVVREQSSTYITVPFETDFSDCMVYEVNAAGWTTNEDTGFRLNTMNYVTGGNEYQYSCNFTSSAADGIINWAQMPPVVIEKSHAIMTLEYTMYSVLNRFSKEAYNSWAENDVFAIQASTDGGETWENVAAHTTSNHPEIAEMTDFVNLQADFTPYTGKTILVRVYWETYNPSGWGAYLVINSIKFEQGELTATPTLSVGDITHNTAKLSWIGTQDSYEIKFGKVGEEPTLYTDVTGSELVMTDLDFSTDYSATIRGVAGEGDYSEWSEPVSFTTANYPDCVAPTDLEANIDNFAEDKSAVLSWVAADDHLSWEVRYRKSSDSEYTYVSDLTETTTTLTELDEETAYLWSVRAACTYDRTTVWSAQSRFETPQCSGLSALSAKNIIVRGNNGYVNILNGPAALIDFVEVYDAAGQLMKRVEVGSTDNVMIPVSKNHGVYMVTVGLNKKTTTYKVVL
ncbi:MAG: T9SS type A sorting domain-containing protein [Bacteroidales bacterium]|nr:T9SS type A sorting domain-containing protein [Bacteroidales bacterium]